jgi:hypothetical protein
MNVEPVISDEGILIGGVLISRGLLSSWIEGKETAESLERTRRQYEIYSTIQNIYAHLYADSGRIHVFRKYSKSFLKNSKNRGDLLMMNELQTKCYKQISK